MGWKFEYSWRESWYTCDEEYDTKEEAIEAGIEWFKEEDPDVEYFDVGRVQETTIPKLHAWHIIDTICDDMYEQCGDASDGWLSNVSKDDEASLERMVNDAVVQWLKQTNNMPKFFAIVDVQSVAMNDEV